MVTTESGRAAEAAVAQTLKKRGYKILSQNWRRPRCEIDIVATKKGIAYFVEVKYRSKLGQGSGLEHITKRKLSQMQFAAQMWVAENDYDGDWRLLAAEVDPNHIKVTEIDII